MVFQSAVLLLLCVSLGMCATIGHYQTQSDKEAAAAAVDSAAVTEAFVAAASVAAAKDDAAPPGDQVRAFPAAENPAANPHFGEKLLAKILSGENPPAKEPAVDVAAEAPDEGASNQGQTSSEEEWNEIRPIKVNQSLDRPLAHEDDGSWSLNSIRNSFQTVHGYFDSLVELVGGHNGVCEYRCKYGDTPEPRAGYRIPEPNGCSSSLVGFQLDLGIPAMTNCCNQLDVCYDTCGSDKYSCDATFRSCLHSICSDLKKSLGFVSKVQACESMADALYNTVWTLGCRPYMNSQRAACVCRGEERDEL